jgi:hypothetical protein
MANRNGQSRYTGSTEYTKKQTTTNKKNQTQAQKTRKKRERQPQPPPHPKIKQAKKLKDEVEFRC